MRALLLSRLSPFRHREFRRFFFVQTLSLVGTWSQDLARAWLVIELMGSAGALGTLHLAVALPTLFLILSGGILVDRVDVRRVMLLTKSLLAVASLALAALVEWGDIQFWHLLIFASIFGAVSAFDSPAYQTLTVRLVPRPDFQQALALNNMNFHSARMLGPLIAGLLMAWHGPSLVFLFDGLSFIGLLFVLWGINLRDTGRRPVVQSQWKAFAEGLRYFRTEPAMRYRILQLLMTISFIFPLLIVVFRTYIQDKFQLSAEEFGYVFTLPALGSMLGSMSFAAIKPKRPIRALMIGIPGTGLLTALLPLAPSIEVASLLMAIAGVCLFLTFSSLTVSMHLEVNEEFRGRMGSIIGLCFLSIGPLMSFPIGFLSDSIGAERAIVILAGLFVLLSALLAFFHGRSLQPQNSSPRLHKVESTQ